MEDISKNTKYSEMTINEFELLRETEKAYKIRYVSKKTMFAVDEWVPKAVCRIEGRSIKIETNFFFDNMPYPAK